MNIFLIVLSLVLVAFGQPAWIPGFGILAGAFGFAIFWKAMLAWERPKDRFLLSLIWFSFVQAIQLSWMTTVEYMGPFIVVVYLFLIIGMGIQFGVLSFFFREPLNWRSVFALAGCWTLFEWVRLFFLCGFTWNPVGLALTNSCYSIQFASVWGIFGLSFWVILVNAIALFALAEKCKRKAILWAAFALFPYLFGWTHQNWIQSRFVPSKTIEVALVQTAIFPEQKEKMGYSHRKYIAPIDQWERILAVLNPDRPVDLIVFSEGSLPSEAHFFYYDLAGIKKYFNPDSLPPLRYPYAGFERGGWKVSNAFILQALANQLNADVIAGLEDTDMKGKYNSAFHFRPHQLTFERYKKRILVPIGEYIPLQKWKRWAHFIGEQFGIYSSFLAGTEVKIFKTDIPIGISICLEETFSDLTRQLRAKGAELFVNLTNDAWFPRSKLARQHFDHGRVRAAENGVSLLRACNTGITSAIDCFGNPLAMLAPSEEKASTLYFSLPLQSYSTLYTWWGDRAILTISIASLLSYFLFRKKKLL